MNTEAETFYRRGGGVTREKRRRLTVSQGSSDA